MKSSESNITCAVCGSPVRVITGLGNDLKLCYTCGNRNEARMVLPAMPRGGKKYAKGKSQTVE